MRLAANLLWVLALVRAPIVGCNQVETAPLTLFVVVSDGVTPLEGVEVCETDTPNCVMTDQNGEATLEVLADELVSYTLEKGGYEARLYADVADERFQPMRQHSLWTDERTAAWYETMASQYPLSGVGTVHVSLVPAFEGATFDLKDATGTAFYDVVTPDPWISSVDLAATTSEGSGGFLNVVAGDFQIELGGTARNCVPNRAWPGDATNRIGFPVREGFITLLTVNCPPPP